MTTTADPNSTTAGLRRILFATAFGLLILVAWVGLPFDVPYVGYGVASAFLFQVALRPRKWEILGELFAAAALVLLDQFVIHSASATVAQAIASNAAAIRTSMFFGFLGLASFTVVGFRAIWGDASEREELKAILLPAAGFTVFIMGSQQLLNLAGLLFPKTADLYAYAFDGSLGFQPSFVIGSVFQSHHWISILGHFTYLLLPVPMAMVCAAHLRQKISAPLYMVEVFLCAGLLGYLLYLTFPAAGPVYVAGPEYPGSPLPLSVLRHWPIQMVPLSWRMARNCMPSLHVTWALLIWFNCKPFSRLVRRLAFAFLLITLFDTLGTGEHYLIDLVVAFPFAVAIQALCTRTAWRSKITPVVGGFSLTLVWPVLLRYAAHAFLLTPVIPWISILITTTLSVVLMRRIPKAEPLIESVSSDAPKMLAAGFSA